MLSVAVSQRKGLCNYAACSPYFSAVGGDCESTGHIIDALQRRKEAPAWRVSGYIWGRAAAAAGTHPKQTSRGARHASFPRLSKLPIGLRCPVIGYDIFVNCDEF